MLVCIPGGLVLFQLYIGNKSPNYFKHNGTVQKCMTNSLSGPFLAHFRCCVQTNVCAVLRVLCLYCNDWTEMLAFPSDFHNALLRSAL